MDIKQVRIENPRRLSLPAEAEAILQRVFPTHRRVVVQAELGSGFSHSRVFLVYPIEQVPELPAVVKVAPAHLIEQEYRAYQAHVRHKLSGAAEIRHAPIRLPDRAWAGLCYRLVGSGIFEIESLHTFYNHASAREIWHVLENRLFKQLAPLWHFSHTIPQFNFQASYDRLLPVNLLLEPRPLSPGASLHLLRPGAAVEAPIQRGDPVRLTDFVVTEIDTEKAAVTLNLPSQTGGDDGVPASYRLRLQPVDSPDTFRVNEVVDPIDGMVTATRADILRGYAQEALGQDVTQTTISTAGTKFPNPLLVLPHILNESHHVRLATVHGDLNMENILLVPNGGDVHLIDFAMTRRDHVLHDLLRLETGVVTWLLPQALAQAGMPAEIIHNLYKKLHYAANSPNFSLLEQISHHLRKPFVMLATIRKAARGCLLAPDDWREYYRGLILYLLGALKFKNLDDMPQTPLPKQVAFWGAASAQRLLQTPPVPEEITWFPSSSPSKNLPSDISHKLPAFIAGPPIAHPRQFFGRERALKRLFNLWKHTPLQNAAIIGCRRSGKTSLLQYLRSITRTPISQLRPGQRNDWLPEPACYRWIFVDFQDARLRTRQGLLTYLLERLPLSPPDPACWQQATVDMDYFMDVVSQRLHTPTIILLDELGVALKRGPELNTAFWESLRSLATNYVRGNLGFVLAAHESPGHLADQGNVGSPFFNIFGYTATLGPLTEAEARELIASSPIPFPPTDVDWILAQSGRWPLLLQILCRERLITLEEHEEDALCKWREYGLRQIAPFHDLLTDG